MWLRIIFIALGLYGFRYSPRAEENCASTPLRKLFNSEGRPLSPQERFEYFLNQHGKAPTFAQDRYAREWFLNMSKRPESEWPDNLSPQLHELLVRAIGKTQKIDLQQQVENFVRKYHRLPGAREDPRGYEWARRQRKLDSDQRPQDLSPELSQLLSAPKAYDSYQEKLHKGVQAAENYLKQHNRLPTMADNPHIYMWIQRQLELDEKKWLVSPRLRTWLRRLKEEKVKLNEAALAKAQAAEEARAAASQKPKVRSAPKPYTSTMDPADLEIREQKALALIEKFIATNHQFPQNPRGTAVYQWIEKYSALPEDQWPPNISDELRSLLRQHVPK